MRRIIFGGVWLKIFFLFLMLSVILVNGWTDAPNAIATCVTTRSMRPKSAVLLAGLFNFLGALIMSLLTPSVAQTVYSIVDFGDDGEMAFRALCAGMCAVVIWALIAFVFGIPTSESHALMSGITGAALGGSMSFDAINVRYWLVVIAGLFVSTVPAFFVSRYIYSVIMRFCADLDRRKTIKYFMRAQRISAAGSAFLHGAQDGQKFMGVFMLGISLADGRGVYDEFEIPLYVVVLCSSIMTLGTFCGGSRIIKKVGDDMVRLDAASGTAADAASSVVLSFCTFLGIPVSTTHSKTSAMMGAGSKTGTGVNRGVVKQMLLAWALTFPICGAIGFLLVILIT